MIDEDEEFVNRLKTVLFQEHREFYSTTSLSGAITIIENNKIDLLIVGEELGDGLGIDLINESRDNGHFIDTIFVSKTNDKNSIVKAIKNGVFHYLVKPFDDSEIQNVVNRALESHALKKKINHVEKGYLTLDKPVFLGVSENNKRVTHQIKQLKEHEFSSVLITGETGTGKGNLAKYINYEINGGLLNFVHISCADIQPNLLEAELFGHEKGAFTDAKTRKKGLFEEADNGILFLDEIDAMPIKLQKKLLYFLDTKAIRRLGSNKEIYINTRLIAATNADLEMLVKNKVFRKDLFFRLNMFRIDLPPLRQRKSDIQILAKYFIDFFNKTFKKNVKSLSDKATEKLLGYDWPGNVRELKNVIERAMIFTKTDKVNSENVILQSPDFIKKLEKDSHKNRQVHIVETGVNKTISELENNGFVTLEQMERRYIEKVLESVNGNKTKAAEILGITRTTLRNKLKRNDVVKN